MTESKGPDDGKPAPGQAPQRGQGGQRRPPRPMPARGPYFAAGAIAAVVVAITVLAWPGAPATAPVVTDAPKPTATPVVPTPPAIAPGVEHDLFPASGLAGWDAEMGVWSNRSGVLSGRGEPSLNARLISKQPYRDLLLTCRARLIGNSSAEIQIHDHEHLVGVSWEASEAWQELRIEARGGVVTATSDGKPLAVEPGTGKSGQGVLGFHVRRDGRLEISHARITELPAP